MSATAASPLCWPASCLYPHFAPFVAGVAAMGRGKFSAYNVGAVLWVVGICTAGYFLATWPGCEHLDKIIWAMIFIPA